MKEGSRKRKNYREDRDGGGYVLPQRDGGAEERIHRTTTHAKYAIIQRQTQRGQKETLLKKINKKKCNDIEKGDGMKGRKLTVQVSVCREMRSSGIRLH